MLAPTPVVHASVVSAPAGRMGTWNTLRIMRECINHSRMNPVIIQAASSIIFLTPEKHRLNEVTTIFEYVRDHIRYVQDVVGVETLCDPAMTMQRKIGDCDDQTMLVASLLESVGYPTRLVVAGYHGAEFEHVYCQVFVEEQWLNCDATEREPIGYAPPFPTTIFVENI